MDNETFEKIVASRSMKIYIPLAVGTGALFALAASLVSKNPPIAILGGSIWVSLLSLIVSMPVVISRVKKNLKNPGSD